MITRICFAKDGKTRPPRGATAALKRTDAGSDRCKTEWQGVTGLEAIKRGDHGQTPRPPPPPRRTQPMSQLSLSSVGGNGL
ncbi:MAG: hypothetical protein ACOVOA_02360, partial [Allorhizobium sp.]